MLRSAEEWYRKINSYSFPEFMNDVHRDWIIKMINAARQETIEECARVSDLKINCIPPMVDKESILSLIKELK